MGCELAVNLGPSVLMSPTLSEQAMAQAQSSQMALRLDWLLQVGGPGKLAKAYGLGPGRSRAAVCPTGDVAAGVAFAVEEGMPDIVCPWMVAAPLVTRRTVLFGRGQSPENAES